jgi:transcriptional regulator with XRE-family HTH domain
MSVLLRGLERERVRRGLTQRELAERAGVNQIYISKLELGRRKAGPDVVRRLSAALSEVAVLVDLVSGAVE